MIKEAYELGYQKFLEKLGAGITPAVRSQGLARVAKPSTPAAINYGAIPGVHKPTVSGKIVRSTDTFGQALTR